MLEYQGKYTTANVMIDEIDEFTVSQIYQMINHEVFTNKVVIMPDTHAGNGSVIGFTMPITDKIIPNIVGVDIGCGMLSENYGKNLFVSMNRHDLDIEIRKKIPFGTRVHGNKNCQFQHRGYEELFYEKVNKQVRQMTTKYNDKFNTHYNPPFIGEVWMIHKCKDIDLDYNRFLNSGGTLGGGNHFIEIGKSSSTKDYWVTVHSGSRQFGLKVCNYWQRKGGKGQMAYIEGDNMYGYFVDMVVAQQYAIDNRDIMQAIISEIADNCQVKESISSIHNFIDFDDFIIRKGAIRSYKGEKMIIPFNMEDGIIICEGKSNPVWNNSAPHGAGRLGSRSWAKKKLSLDKAKHDMDQKNIYSSNIPHDEIKGAYKDPIIIEKAIGPTAKIIDRIVPFMSMKD